MNYVPSLNSSLHADERILWSGAPLQGLRMRKTDWFMIPFTILWAGFTVMFVTTAVVGGAPVPFVIFGGLFACVGLYITIGRFFVDAMMRRQTQYTVTNHRVLVESGSDASPRFTLLYLRNLQSVKLTRRGDGAGTINFGGGMAMAHVYAGFHMPGSAGMLPTQFELIENVDYVYETIVRAQHDARF